MKLKEACKQRGLTLTELAKRCEIARGTLSRIANGAMTTQATFARICKELGVEPEEIADIQYSVTEIHGKEAMQNRIK